MEIKLKWIPHYNEYVMKMYTSLRWPPHFDGHFPIIDDGPLNYDGQLITMDTSLTLAPHFNGHLITMATSLTWTLHYDGHFIHMGTAF